MSSGCGALTREEASEALEEVKVASQAEALSSESIEITTQFTLGEGLRAAGESLRDLLAAEAPCAVTTLEVSEADDSTDDSAATGAARLEIEYGKLAGSCGHGGRALTGKHTVQIVRSEPEFIVVDHVFEELSNGKVQLDGAATVEWNLEDPSRHVVHDLTWTRLSDARSAVATGDRVQKPLEGGLKEGFRVDGEHRWQGRRGDWDLAIDGVEMRWIDPVPQAGTYTLDTPFGKRVSVEFTRLDDTTIGVTVAGPRRSFDFEVVTLPGD
jgi:hypothetical protein